VSVSRPAAGGEIIIDNADDIYRATLVSSISEVGTTVLDARERLAAKLERIASEIRR
jgi:hypothetical protein